jgi:hypothetical protein
MALEPGQQELHAPSQRQREDVKAGMEVAQGPRDAHACLPRLLAAVGVLVSSESRAKTNGANYHAYKVNDKYRRALFGASTV